MMQLGGALLVGAGGFLGSILRYVLGSAIGRWTSSGGIPLGTLGVNVLGCMALGMAMGFHEAREDPSANVRLFLMVGVLGGFTTFSTFGYETLELFRQTGAFLSAVYVVAQVSLGLLAAWAGYALAGSFTAS